MDTTSRVKTFTDSLKNLSTESKTGVVLALTFFLSLFLSLFFVIGPAVKGGWAVSGGSDAYYNMHIVQYILSTHHQLLFDPSLNYPIGLENPRPPFFHWLIVLLGYAFSPLLGGVYNSTMTMFLASTAIGGAFIVFPTYYLGKELFGYKVGLIAALLVAMSPLTLMKSIGSIGLFDIFTALFGLMFIYYFLRAVNTFKFDMPESPFLKSLVRSIKSNPISVIYSLLAGVSLAASMLTWVGSISLMLILAGAAVVQLAIFAIKRKSALSIFVSNLFFGSAFIIAYPWYKVAGFVAVRFEYPLIMWAVLLLASIYFLILQKRPWLTSLGLFIVAAAAGILLLYKFDKGLIESILSGQHYFIKNKIYDTIAEAQALPLGEDLMEFGAFPFFASFVGLAYLVYKWVRTATFNMTLAVLYFGGIIVISMIASKFLYFGATAASILTGYIIVKAFELLAFREAVEKSKGRSVRTALRREFKFAHYAMILIVVFLLVVPTTFYAVDSAIPYNNKTSYDNQLYNDTPSFLKPQNYSSPYYLGAFGAALATPNQPLNTALSWFQNQDAQQAPSQRPAFVSWWDYGFQTLEQGDHPVMADNFQDGVFPAAQILLAQNESEIISVLIARMLDNYTKGEVFNNSAIIPTLEQYLGQNGTDRVMSFETNPHNYIPQILADPSYYGEHSSTIQPGDAIYILLEHYLTNTYSLNTLINLYSAVEQFTSKYMSYIAIDSGLFPFNATSTGIFYAPAYLGDFPYANASGEIVPTTFYNINVTDTSGNTYSIQTFPSGDTASSYTITYSSAFYNSTIYRGFIGYPPSAIGASGGVPGFSSNMTSYPAMQGWGMSNFEVAYKTVLWNPYTDYQNHSSAWKTVSLEQGYYYMKNHDGTVDLFPPSYVLSNDVVFLQYYPGAIISGQVTNSNGQAVPGVRVTLTDQYGIPHQTVLTNATGYYSIYAVAGNDTITYTTGPYNSLYMIGNKALGYYNVSISNAQANRDSYTLSGLPTWNITHNLVINSTQANGIVYLDVSHIGIYNSKTDVTLSAEVKYYNSSFNTTYYANTTQNGTYNIPYVAPYTYSISANVYGTWYDNLSTVAVNTTSVSKDVRVDFGTLNVTLKSGTSLSSGSEITFTKGNGSVTYGLTSTVQKYYLPTGIYNVSAFNGGRWDNFTTRSTNNTTTHLTLSFTQSSNITFIIQVNGQPVSAPVVIHNETSTTQMVQTDSNGIAHYGLKASTYTVYTNVFYDGSYYSATEILNVSGSMTVFLNLQPSYLVYGFYKINNVGQTGARVTITGNDSFVSLTTNNTGYFSVYLPRGEYNAVGYSDSSSSPYVASVQFTLVDQSIPLGLYGYAGQIVSGNVSYSGSPVSGIVTSQVNGAPYYDTFDTSSGSYRIYVQDGVALQGVNFISPGYSVQSSSSTIISLKVLPVSLSIEAFYSGNAYIKAYLNGTSRYVVTGTHFFNLSVIPGNYSIAFSDPGTTTTSNVTAIDVVPGLSSQNFYASLSIKARLYVDPVYRVYIFQNATLVATSLNSTLPIGTYTIYSYYGSTAALERINLTTNSTVKLTYQTAYNVSLVTSPSANVTISTAYGAVSWSGSILLPKGQYTFTLEKSYNLTYIYYASSSAYVSSPQTITLNGVLKQVLSTVSISFRYASTTVTSGTYYVQGPENATGSFGSGPISLPYGSYSIYATSGNVAFFGGFNVTGQTENLSYTLQKAYPLNYGTYLNNSSYRGMIHISGVANYYLPPSGIINLPNGSYVFKASTSYVYFGFTDNYTVDQIVKVSGISSATLPFKIDSIVNVTFLAESGTPTLRARQPYTFPLLITSESNIPLTFTIGNSSSIWISGSSITLAPYSSGETNITVRVPPGTVSGFTAASVRVYYGGTNQNVNINVTVALVENISAKINNSTGKIVGNLLEIPLTVSNTGNNQTEVNATVLNSAQLSSEGITVTFNNSTTLNEKLYSNTNNTTYLIVKSTSGKSVVGQQISIILYYDNTTKIVTTTLTTPELSVSSATGTGQGLSPYSHLTQDYYIYAFSAFIVLAMIAVMLIFRRRFRS
jgi:dolichyl-diphosphooligosaccharide--protein glycosyltransferase